MDYAALQAMQGIEGISGNAHLSAAQQLIQPESNNVGSANASNQADFSSWISHQVGEVNQAIITADHELQKLAVGEADNLHQVMFAMEKAKTQFELVVQIRNRLLEAYQEVSRLQI